jgi:GNAT superfamily N-acetyltransferase
MIRQATKNDLPALAQMGLKFVEEGSLPFKIIPKIWVKNWSKFMDMGIGHVLLSTQAGQPTGTIGAFFVPDPNNDEPIMAEAFWYVLPEHRGAGVKLLISLEGLAKRLGAKRLSMVHLHSINSDKLGKLYEARGYKPTESHYIKEIE